MAVLLEARPYRPFKSSEEYLVAMKEDLAEWLNALYPELRINVDNFMDRLDTGVALCKHANNVRKSAAEYVARRQARKISMTRSITSSLALPMSQLSDVAFLPNAKAGTFFARDNVSNFIGWCRNSLGIIECLLFETDDLIMRKNERHVILCMLEVARRGAKFGMLAPMLVQMERQIDREIAAENKAANGGLTQANGNTNEDSDDEYDADMHQDEPCLIYGPQPQIVTNDLKSLDEMVRDLVERCTCPTQFPMIRVSEGKYRIGDTKVLIFVRILRSHVMVRVGGGWDTLSHYLDKHDPCRCRTSHRSMISAKLIQKAGGSFDLGSAQVHYERSPPRTRRSSASSVGSCAGTTLQNQQSSATAAATAAAAAAAAATTAMTGGTTVGGQLHAPRSVSSNRSRSPTPQQQTNNKLHQQQHQHQHQQHHHHHHQHQLHHHQHQHQYQLHHQQQQQQQQQQLGDDQQRKINRSRSPTPQRKFFNSPVHHHHQQQQQQQQGTTNNIGDSGKQRSRSPTPKLILRSRSPTPKVDQHVKIVDSPRKIYNDDSRNLVVGQAKHSSDPKRELHQEIKAKVPLSEEFTRRYVVDGGVARRAVEREDTPKYEATIYNYKCREDSSSSRSPTPSPPAIKEEPALESFTKDTITNTNNTNTNINTNTNTNINTNTSTTTSNSNSNTSTVTSNVNYAKSLHGDGEHSDNCSEVSDEGYRSLGAVQPSSTMTTIITTTTTTTTTANGNNTTAAAPNAQSSPTVADSQKQPPTTRTEQQQQQQQNEDRSCVETESIETGLRKTRIGGGGGGGGGGGCTGGGGSPLRASPARSVASSSGDRTPRAGSVIRETSNVSRASSSGSRTPRDSNSSPEGSPLKRGTIRNSLRKPPTGSLSKASALPKSSGVGQLSTSGSNTWNGRQARHRPSLQSDTFLNPQGSVATICCSTITTTTTTMTPSFSRKSTVRQSLPRPSSNGGGPQYDRNGRRIKQQSSATGSLQSSPTKVANPLLEQILQKVGHLRDDREVVQKLQDLLRDYQVNSLGENDPTLDFTRAWIDGNGTVALPQQDGQMVAASPRKDPKAASDRGGGGFSRIPAPIYKRPMSVASDSV